MGCILDHCDDPVDDVTRDTPYERHEKELEVLRTRIKKLERTLGECVVWLQSGYDIITDNDMGDEDDDERCVEIIEEAKKLLSEKI